MFLSVNKSSISRFLEQAVLSDERRKSFIYKALHTFIQNKSLASTAFIWGENDGENYEIVTVGLKETEIYRWLSKLPLKLSELSFIASEKNRPLKKLHLSIFPTFNDSELTGIWLIWGNKLLSQHDEQVSFILPYLEVITVIDKPKEISVDANLLHEELIEAFRYKDPSSIIAMLTLTRVISDADFVYWGDIVNNNIQITHHLGALKESFSFELAVGEGLGGKAAHSKNILTVEDYKNSPYRVERVSRIVDKENIRSGLVVPLKDEQIQTSGVLYVTRRHIKPFSLLQQLSLARVFQSIEPLRYENKSRQFFYYSNPFLYPLQKHKNELRTLTEQEKDLATLEKWAERILKGTLIVVDENGSPYNIARSDELITSDIREITLQSENGIQFGKIYYSTAIPLHQSDWPDVIEDIASSCRIILERQLLLHRGETYNYTLWVHSLLTKGVTKEQYYDGSRLRLPIDKGEVWVVTWDVTKKLAHATQLRLVQLTLKLTKRRLIFFNQFGILLFDFNDKRISPDYLRNELLKIFPAKLWLVHGSSYNSFSELKVAVNQAINLAKSAKSKESSQFILELEQTGLDLLFREKDVHHKLDDFSFEILQPLIDYDKRHHSNFTETLVYDCLLQSPEEVAKHLFIHKNTVLYRVKRAKEILNINTDFPKNRIALELASYQWVKNKNPNFLTSLNLNKTK